MAQPRTKAGRGDTQDTARAPGILWVSGFGVDSLGSGVRGLGFELWGLGRVHGVNRDSRLGLGVIGEGLGIRGSGVRG